MREKIRFLINVVLIILMPLMTYITVGSTKINFSMADFILIFVGVILLINIKKFFVNKRWLYILYFVGLLISLLLSQFIGGMNKDFLHVSSNVMIMEMIKTVIVGIYFLGAFMFIDNKKTYKIVLTTISLSGLLVFLIGISSYTYLLLGKEFFIKIFQVRTLRFLGTFKDPNLCALYFIVVFFISLLNFRTTKNIVLRYLMAFISIVSFLSIILTMSRGGWVAFVIAIIVFIILNIKNFRKENLLAIVSIIIILLSFLNMDYYLQDGKITNRMIGRIKGSLSQDISKIDRVELSKTAFQMGNDNFIVGVGKGSFPLNSYRYLGKDSRAYKAQHIPHNTILGFYAQQGIIGVLMFSVLPMYILYLMMKSKRKQNIYFISMFIGIAIQSMAINVENVRFLWYIFGVMLVGEKLDINLINDPSVKMNNKNYIISLGILLVVAIVLFNKLKMKFGVC